MQPLDVTGTVDLCALLDARAEKWGLHRGQGSGDGPIWVVTLGVERDWRDPVRRTFHAATIEGALQAAVDAGPPLPVIPRCPARLHRHSFEARKVGAKWSLYYEGRPAGCGNLPSKRVCEETADRWVAARDVEIEVWAAAHGATARGVEGVDFRWRE